MGYKERILPVLGTIVFIITIFFLFAGTLGFLRQEFQEGTVNLSRFNLYSNWGLGFLIGIVVIFIIEIIYNKGDSLYGEGIGFASKGEFPSLKLFRRFTYPQIFLLSLIVTLSLGLINNIYFSQTTFGSQTYTGTGLLVGQQFSSIDNILFNSFLVPIPENLGAAFVISLIFLSLKFLANKYKWDKSTFLSLLFILSILGVVIFSLAWHNTVYPDSDISKMVVAAFWGLGAFLTLVTGTFLVFFNLHLSNNLFFDLHKHFSQDIVIVTIVLLLGILVAVYGYAYRDRLLGKKNE